MIEWMTDAKHRPIAATGTLMVVLGVATFSIGGGLIAGGIIVLVWALIEGGT